MKSPSEWKAVLKRRSQTKGTIDKSVWKCPGPPPTPALKGEERGEKRDKAGFPLLHSFAFS